MASGPPFCNQRGAESLFFACAPLANVESRAYNQANTNNVWDGLMKAPFSGAIDCDIHPSAPDMPALLPYMSEYWRDQITNRFIHKTPFSLTSHKPGVPING